MLFRRHVAGRVTLIATLLAGSVITISVLTVSAITANAQPAGFFQMSPEERAAYMAKLNAASSADHRNMMEQLGITALRPGPSGDDAAPNHANYDETLANPFPHLPDLLSLKNGSKVPTPAVWQRRRREIVEEFEREVLGRVSA